MRRVLDEELDRLPEKYRVPLILCYLEGRTYTETAKLLGWADGTVCGRLSRARELLRHRLTRRGLTLSTAMLAAISVETLAAPAASVAGVNRMVRAFLLSQSMVGTTSTAVEVLARGLVKTMALSNLKMAAAGLTVFCVCAASAGWVTQRVTKDSSAEPQDVLAQVVSDEPSALGVAGGLIADRQQARTDLYGDPLPPGALARMGTVRWNHAGLGDMRILPGGKTIHSIGSDRFLRYWDMETGQQVRAVRLQGTADLSRLRRLIFSPDCKTAVAVDEEKFVFWEVETGRVVKSFPATQTQIVDVEFSPDGIRLMVATRLPQPKVSAWEWETGTERNAPFPEGEFGMNNNPFHMGLSPDGKLLVAGGGMQLPLCVYELATGREIHRFLCDASTSKISPDGKRLAVAGMTTSPGHVGTIIRIFDLTTGEEKAAYPLGYYAQFTSLVFAPDGRALACCGVQITSCVLDSTTGRILHKLPGWPFRPSFSSDSKLLVYTNASVANSERINLLDMATGRHLHDQPGDLGQITALALSPDGRHLAAGNWLSPAVTLWDTKDGRMMRTFPLKGEKRYVRNVAFSADGQTLAACQPQGFLKLWDVATGGEKQSVQLMDLSAPKGGAVIKGGGVRAFDDLQMSSDFKQVRTTNRLNGNTPMRLATWETATGNEVGEWHLQIQSMRVNWLAEGKAVAMPSQEGLTLMDLSTDQVRWRLSDQGFGLTAASSDGRQLAVAKEKGDRSQPRIIRFPDLRDGHRP